jgi:hypothetical protein
VVLVDAPAATKAPLTGALLRSLTLPATDAVTVMAGGGGVASLSVFLHPQTIPINVTIISKQVLLFWCNVFIVMLFYIFWLVILFAAFTGFFFFARIEYENSG